VTPEWLAAEALEGAWEHVLHNGGCAGADGVTLSAFAPRHETEFADLRRLIECDEYRPLPLLPITVEKKLNSPETRTLMVPAVRDRVVQTAVGRQLGRAFEDDFLECSFAYRPHRSVDSAVARIRFWHDHGFRYVADADIDSFFDRISHDDLRRRLDERIGDARLRGLLVQWIQCPYWDGGATKPRREGIPQGSPISPLLANFFLSDFDLALEKAGYKLIRYADDFLVLASDAAAAGRALAIAQEQLEAMHLTLKQSKTRISSFDEGFHFLGVYFLGRDLWIPWKTSQQHRRVLAVPRPMPAAQVRRWLEPVATTTMARAFAAAAEAAIAAKPATEGEEDAMAYLYLTEQGSILRKIGNRLVVEKEDAILLDRPYHKLDAVLVFGNVQITTQAMIELMDCGIPLSFLSRQGEARGQLEPARGKNIPLRLAQYQLHAQPERCLALARQIIAAKLANSAAVLAHFGDREESGSMETQVALQQLAGAGEKALQAPSLEALDGVEGAAARLYFDTLMRRNKSGLTWPGRVKHPATDPINALLSFGYTLVVNELAGLLEAVGLDSYLGVLHQLDYGRRSLAFDLVEAFRAPLVDRMVLTLLNRRQFGEADFETLRAETEAPGTTAAGLYLRPEPAKHFLHEYEIWMLHSPQDHTLPGFRALLRAEVEGWAGPLRAAPAENHFQPFLYKG